MLGHAFGESQKDGNRSIENIKKNSRYEIIEENHPVNKIKVVAIDGRRVTIEQLQNTALLFKRPSLLVGAQAWNQTLNVATGCIIQLLNLPKLANPKKAAKFIFAERQFLTFSS